MTFTEALSFLDTLGQSHLLEGWADLTEVQRKHLLEQIAALNPPLIRQMRELVQTRAASRPDEPEPAEPMEISQGKQTAALTEGERALRRGKVGLILVAGGQGTRLGFEGPKGCFSIGSLSGDSLFAIHAKKALALQRRYGIPLPLYIMTSEANDSATRAFFEEHHFFGLPPPTVHFFRQGMLPAMFPDGRLVLEDRGRLFWAPDGHGGLLQALEVNGLLDHMRGQGIETLFYFQVDNPLVAVADPVFVGLHRLHRADYSLKVCGKRDAEEGLGVIVRHGQNGLRIVEYTELTPEQKKARRPDGRLRFYWGSVAIHLFSRSFLEQTARIGLPLHVAHKKVPYFDGARTVQPAQPNAYKFEKFIFDALPIAETALAVAFDRAEEFSPVKNATGADSPLTAQRDMTRKFARWLEQAGARVARRADGEIPFAIEIDPLVADSPEALRARIPVGLTVSQALWLNEAMPIKT